MDRRQVFKCGLGVLLIASVAAGTASAFTPWANANGSASFFDWANGGSDNGLFGSPSLVAGNTFVFTPSGFRAEATNGGQQITADRLEVDLIAHPGFEFTQVRVVERGDFAIVTPDSNSEATATANLFLSSNLQGALFEDDVDSVTYTTGNGNWQLETIIDLTPYAGQGVWTDLELVLNNNLIAVASANGATFIEKKLAGSEISIELIPEPATGLLLLAAGFMLRRR